MSTDEEEKRKFLLLAEQAFAELKKQQEVGAAKKVRDLWAIWFPTVEETGGGAARRVHGRYVLDFKVPFEDGEYPVGDLRWPEFTHDRVMLWKAAMLRRESFSGRKLSKGYCDLVRMTLQSCFAYHVKVTHLMSRNPLVGIPRELRKPPRRQGYFTPEQFEDFLGYCRPMLAAMLRLSARAAGLRANEVRTLRKDQVDYLTREVAVVNKGGNVKRVLLTSDAMEIIRDWVKVSPGEFVFANPRDRRGLPLPKGTLWNWVDDARREWGMKIVGEKPVFHSARHSFTMAMMVSAPSAWIASQLGHTTTKQVVETYGALRGEEKEVMRKLMEQSPLGLRSSGKKADPTGK
jgi:integrase